MRKGMRGMTGLLGKKRVKNGSVVYLYDTFTDVNGTPITSHMPDVGVAYLSGGLAIVNNELANNGTGFDVGFNVNSGISKVSFKAKVFVDRYGLSVRKLANANRYFMQILGAFNIINLFEIKNDVWVFVASGSGLLSAGDMFEIIDDGKSIKLSVNGVIRINYATTFLNTENLNVIEITTVGDSLDSLEVASL